MIFTIRFLILKNKQTIFEHILLWITVEYYSKTSISDESNFIVLIQYNVDKIKIVIRFENLSFTPIRY